MGSPSPTGAGRQAGKHPRAYPQAVHVVLATRPTVMSRPPPPRGRNLRLGRPTPAAQGQPPTAAVSKRAARRGPAAAPPHTGSRPARRRRRVSIRPQPSNAAAAAAGRPRRFRASGARRRRRGAGGRNRHPRQEWTSAGARHAKHAHAQDHKKNRTKTKSGPYLEAGTGQQRSSTTNASPPGGAPPPPARPLPPLAAADDPHRLPPRHNGKAWGAGSAQRSGQRERSARRLVHVGQRRGRGDGRPQVATGATRQATAGGTSWFYDRAAAAAAATAGSLKHRERSASGGEKNATAAAAARHGCSGGGGAYSVMVTGRFGRVAVTYTVRGRCWGGDRRTADRRQDGTGVRRVHKSALWGEFLPRVAQK